MKRTPGFNSLLKQLGAVPDNVASLKYDPANGSFEATFRAVEPVLSAPLAASTFAPQPAEKPKLVPGTNIPDDDSPLHPFDLVLTPPNLSRH